MKSINGKRKPKKICRGIIPSICSLVLILLLGQGIGSGAPHYQLTGAQTLEEMEEEDIEEADAEEDVGADPENGETEADSSGDSSSLKDPKSVPMLQLVDFQGERTNQLTGIGLVTGLAGRGDSPKDPLLRQALTRFTRHFGLDISPEEIQGENCAVVGLTLELPPYSRNGQTRTVRLSALGDAKGLAGGELIQAPLKGADGKVYAVAQGTVEGYSGEEDSASGRIPEGAVMERSVLSDINRDGAVHLLLKRPGFRDAQVIAEGLRGEFGDEAALVEDPSLVALSLPEGVSAAEAAARIEELRVVPSRSSRVVVDSRAGVVVMGSQVRIAPVAVSCRGVEIEIGQDRFDSSVSEAFMMDGNADVQGLVGILQELKLGTDTVVEVLRSIDEAGALYGDLVIR